MARASIILGSASPRRRELLRQIGVECEVQTADIDERAQDNEAPAEYVLRLAIEKANRVASIPVQGASLPVLAADTAVVVDGRILGKPADRADGLWQLRQLSGREHEVLTGVALALDNTVKTRLSVSHVRFRRMDTSEIAAYWDTGEPADKAGSYAVQGIAAVFIQEIRGSYSGIMGLPLYETAQLLRGVGHEIPRIRRTT
jgi:septum formation protein